MSHSLSWDERVLAAMARAKLLPLEYFETASVAATALFRSEAKPRHKRLARAALAAASGWSQAEMEETVLALAKILMDAAKAELGEHHFRAAVTAMDVPSEHADALTKLYLEHADAIKASVSRETGTNIPQYQSLEWRIDLEVGSRFVRHSPKPIVTLSVDTLTQPSSADLPLRRFTCMRVDYDNLRNLERQLENALREVDATHASRIQRYLH
ncbi:hypothetical protein PybrP1_012212 [[Pythium] brassicae (nom. inval.)]|nr:hypothetical protein PybrP1_012212 [[Pythium] brassicae (nom. inval.)]